MPSSHYYQAFGITFASSLELPTLPCAEGPEEVVIQVERGMPPPVAPAYDAPFPWMRGRFPPDFTFESRPDRITIWVPLGYEDDLLRTYLLGYVLGVCLRQRGMLVLHAACVALGDRAVAFVGSSGWGKSTLAAHFVKRGYDLLADDLTGLRLPAASPPLAYPGLAHIRLYPDSGSALLPGYAGLPRLNTYSKKRVGYAPPRKQEPRPLVKLYALEGVFAGTVGHEPLTPGEAFPHLAMHTRALHEFNAPYLKRHLDQCADLLRAVPMSLLRRRKSIEALDEVVSLVEEDAGLAAVPAT